MALQRDLPPRMFLYIIDDQGNYCIPLAPFRLEVQMAINPCPSHILFSPPETGFVRDDHLKLIRPAINFIKGRTALLG